MPELPEVETIKNVLSNIVVGHTITKIDVLRKGIIQGNEDDFVKYLTNQTFLSLSRIGKYLFFHLSNDLVIISHLRMEGKYFEYNEKEKNSTFARIVFHLNNNKKLCYDDSRCFGIMILSNEDNYKFEKEIAKLGPEPFDVNDINPIFNKVNKLKQAIKTTLLDQTVMTGIGNIYADEILFACNINPTTPTNLVTKSDWEHIVENAKRILKQAILSGGSTIRSYHPGKNIDGNFQVNLLAYGRKYMPCLKCGHIMRFIKVNGRGTTYCPNCQKKLGKPIKIAIVGEIASGKSTCLNVFKTRGYNVYSADEIVHELYENKTITNKINQMFNLPYSETVNRVLLTQKILQNPINKIKLERFVHPLVNNKIQEIIKTSKDKLLIFEIPLLFEAKMEDEFDVIIGITADKDKRIERQNLRDKQKALSLRKINEEHNLFLKNKAKLDYLLVNDELDSFIKDCNTLINKFEDRLD